MPVVSNLYCTVVKARRKHKLIISQCMVHYVQHFQTPGSHYFKHITSKLCTVVMLSLSTHHKIINIELIWLFMINLHLNLHNSSANYYLFNKKWKDMLIMLWIYILKKILTGYILLEKYCHKKFHNITLSCIRITPTTKVCRVSMLVLLTV